jgi:hypothetical protein
MRAGFSTKRFDSGSTLHHAHKLPSDDELRQKWQLSRKEVATIMKFPGDDDAQGKEGLKDRQLCPACSSGSLLIFWFD